MACLFELVSTSCFIYAGIRLPTGWNDQGDDQIKRRLEINTLQKCIEEGVREPGSKVDHAVERTSDRARVRVIRGNAA